MWVGLRAEHVGRLLGPDMGLGHEHYIQSRDERHHPPQV